MGTTKGYKHLAGGGVPYQFEAEKSYAGTMSVKKLRSGLESSGTLSHDGALLTEFSHIDEGSDINNFGMLAFHINSVTFGTSNEVNSPGNGLDFANVRVEILE